MTATTNTLQNRPNKPISTLYSKALLAFATGLALIGFVPLLFFGGTFFTTFCLAAGGGLLLWLLLKPEPSFTSFLHPILISILLLSILLLAFSAPKELTHSFTPSAIAPLHWLICCLMVFNFWHNIPNKIFYPLSLLAASGVAYLFIIQIQPFLKPGLFTLSVTLTIVFMSLYLPYKKPLIQSKQFFSIILLLLFVYIVILQSAWLCDDAFITFRTIDNALHGYGLRWNIAERVQTYTHPLYMLCLTACIYFTHEFYYTPILFNIIITALALIILIRYISPSFLNALLALITLSFSKAFIDYATSGLENSLTYFLLASFVALYFASIAQFKKNIALGIVAGLAVFNRLDTILFFIPTIGWCIWKTVPPARIKALLQFAVGFIPLFLWEIFAILYYGFPFPNTAYAKLFLPHFSGSTIFHQGNLYLLNSFSLDPITLIIILLASLSLLSNQSTLNIPIFTGMLLYLLYVIKIGGDFMSGRFLAAPFFLSAIIFFRSFTAQPKHGVLLLFSLALLSSITTFNPWRTGINYNGVISHHFITDERQFYYQSTGLLRTRPAQPLSGSKEHQTSRRIDAALFSQSTRRTTVHIAMGILGFYSGPHVYIIDEVALCDPLLARIPSWCKEFCPGHMIRKIPGGYLTSINENNNQLSNPHLHQLYDKLRLITRAPIFSVERFREIVKLNLGYYDFSSNLTFYLTPRPHKPLPFDLTDDDYAKLIHQAQVYIDDSDYLRLEDCLLEAIKLNPKRPEARIYLGILYEYLGEMGKAEDCFKYFLSGPENSWQTFYAELQKDRLRELQP